jgi:hypothetical protein
MIKFKMYNKIYFGISKRMGTSFVEVIPIWPIDVFWLNMRTISTNDIVKG